MPKQQNSACDGEGQDGTTKTYQTHDGGTPNGTLVTGLYGLQGPKARLSLAPRVYCESYQQFPGCLARNKICGLRFLAGYRTNRFIMRGLPPQGIPGPSPERLSRPNARVELSQAADRIFECVRPVRPFWTQKVNGSFQRNLLSGEGFHRANKNA